MMHHIDFIFYFKEILSIKITSIYDNFYERYSTENIMYQFFSCWFWYVWFFFVSEHFLYFIFFYFWNFLHSSYFLFFCFFCFFCSFVLLFFCSFCFFLFIPRIILYLEGVFFGYISSNMHF